MRWNVATVDWAVNEQRRRSGNRFVRLGALAVMTGLVIALVDGLAHPTGHEPGAMPLFLALTLLGLLISGPVSMIVGGVQALLSRNLDPLVLRPASVDVDDQRLIVHSPRGTRSVRRADVESGWIDPAGKAVVQLRDGTEIRVSTSSERDAQALLEALSLDASHRVATFQAESAGAGLGIVQLPFMLIVGLGLMLSFAMVLAALMQCLALVGLGHEAPNVAGAIATTLIAPVFSYASWKGVRACLKKRVTVGTDGVRIQGASTRFIPFSSVQRVVREPRGVRIVEQSWRSTFLGYTDESEALGARIEAAMGTRGASGGKGSVASALDRGGRSFDAWKEDLRGALKPKEGYREAALDPEDLAAVVEDGSAPAELRVGAALALSQGADDAAKRRVRIAAEASTNTMLREALEEAAEGEIDEHRMTRLAGMTI